MPRIKRSSCFHVKTLINSEKDVISRTSLLTRLVDICFRKVKLLFHHVQAIGAEHVVQGEDIYGGSFVPQDVGAKHPP